MPLETRTYKDASGNTQTVIGDNVGADWIGATKLIVAADGAAGDTDLVSDARPMPSVTVYGTTAGGAVTVGTTATRVPASPSPGNLAGRRRYQIQNRHATKVLAIGFSSGVTVANAPIVLAPWQAWTENLGPGVAVWAIGEEAGQDVRYAEFAT